MSAKGTVKWYNTAKKLGFIIPDIEGEDVYVHYKALMGAGIDVLKEGQRVEYDLKQGARGTEAANVKLI